MLSALALMFGGVVAAAYETVDGSHWVPDNWIETWASLENSGNLHLKYSNNSLKRIVTRMSVSTRSVKTAFA